MSVLPRDHADYTELNDCPCILCTEYRTVLGPYVKSAETIKNHLSHCHCRLCENHRILNNLHLAADGKRTLWCESIFIVSDKPWGDQFLDWMEGKILNDHTWAMRNGRPDPIFWWVHEGENKTMAFWLEEWANSLSSDDIAMMSADKILRENAVIPGVRVS